MYEYLKGKLMEATVTKAVVDVQGLGYGLLIPFNNFSKLPSVGASVTFFVSFIVREDSQRLYGFLARHERDLFETLLEVSGIGPKTALGLVGHMEPSHLQAAIAQGNVQQICKIPGVGKKTAERLVVEMRDKMKKGLGQVPGVPFAENELERGPVADATSALINLGYNIAQAQKGIKSALSKLPEKEEPELAKLITLALRCI